MISVIFKFGKISDTSIDSPRFSVDLDLCGLSAALANAKMRN